MAKIKQMSGADLSRNTALAGQTVSKGGYNITYDSNGYATSASNYNHSSNRGTDRGIAAPSADAVLSGGNRTVSGGSSSDRKYMSDQDLTSLGAWQKLYQEAQRAGDRTQMDFAHEKAEQLRNKYGYSGGADGSGYSQIYVQKWNPDGGGGGSGGGRGGSGVGGDFSYGNAPGYINRYQDKIDELTAQILGREAFSYDPETDPTFQQYKESYTRGGERAMQDMLAQLSARTGGLASSYAGSAAQQTYDNYMSALSDKIPELRQLAYSMYQDEGNNLRDNLSMLASLEQGEYGKFADQLAQYNTDRNFNYGAYRDQIADQKYADETAWTRGNYTSEQEYNRALEKAQMLASIGDFSGYRDLGYSDQEISNLTNAYNAAQLLAQQSTRRSGGGYGKPRLTYAQTLDAIENGQITDSVIAAYDYYVGNGAFEQFFGNQNSNGNTSLNYDQDEGIFTWNGREYNDIERLYEDLNNANLTAQEEAELKRKLALFNFDA